MSVFRNMADVSKQIGLLVFVFLTPAIVLAEDSEPKDFYRHDYAKSTYEKKESKVDPTSNDTKIKHRDKNSKNEGIVDADPGFKEMKEEKAPEIKEDTTYLDKDGNNVLSVGLITSADNENHTIENLTELTELANKNDWGIGEIYIVGSNMDLIKNPAIRNFMRLFIFRSGKISYSEKIPEKYAAVKKSPTWIVQTEKGQVLLEAIGPLRKKFNKNGQLLE